jgi:hypothetical protein
VAAAVLNPPARVSRHPLAGASALLAVLTIILTWPQVLHLGSRVAAHSDPLLSMWRISWIAHVLPRQPQHLVDGNIFSPHVRTLAYSDATLLEGLIALPWLWAHTNPILVYNALLLAGIVLSGIGMFVLVRHLSGNDDAALVAAVIFTMLPYRILHFMHLELQWTMWMPLTMWAVHRVFETGSIRYGVVAGALLGLQAISSVYYGVFLGIIVAAQAVLLAITEPGSVRRAAGPLCIGAALALVVMGVYARPYVANTSLLGVRDAGEVANFSARLSSYITAPQENWLWGWTAYRFEGDELRLLPGIAAVALAALALALRRHRRIAAIYLALMLLAAALSLGFNNPVYRLMYAYVWPIQGFRAPARFAILAGCALAVLGGFGFVYLQQRFSGSRFGRGLLVGVLVAISVEYGSAPMHLDELPRELPDVYRFLRILDRSVIVEVPFVDWGLAPVYMYWSTQHWHQLVNGYSGFSPPDYAETLARMQHFPDERSIQRLKSLNVRYIVVHEAFYKPKDHAALLLRLGQRHDIALVGKFRDWVGGAHLFELKKGLKAGCPSPGTGAKPPAGDAHCL